MIGSWHDMTDDEQQRMERVIRKDGRKMTASVKSIFERASAKVCVAACREGGGYRFILPVFPRRPGSRMVDGAAGSPVGRLGRLCAGRHGHPARSDL